MDIPLLSISLANSKASQTIGILMTKMAKEQMEQTGEQLVQIMKTAEVPSDSIIDIRL